MIELILEMPMDLKIILGSGFIIVLYEYLKEEIWVKQNQNDHQSKKY